MRLYRIVNAVFDLDKYKMINIDVPNKTILFDETKITFTTEEDAVAHFNNILLLLSPYLNATNKMISETKSSNTEK